jgi:hypothetical protein
MADTVTLPAAIHPERQYLALLDDLLAHGVRREDRTGVGTLGLFGRQIRFDLAAGFPLLTTKKLHLKSIVLELLWFLRGETNIAWLKERGVSIWDEWADEAGELGPVYGKQWRSWAAPDGRSIDQIARVIEGLKTNPYSRRHIVSAWNPADVDDIALSRRVSRRAVQHRLLRAADDDGGASRWAEARRFRAHVRRSAPLSEPCGPSARTADAHAAPVPADEDQSRQAGHFRLRLRGFRTRRLPGAQTHQGAGGGVRRLFYDPRDSDPEVRKERVKLFSGGLNALGVALLIGSWVAPLFDPSRALPIWRALAGGVAGGLLVLSAIGLLRYMKARE